MLSQDELSRLTDDVVQGAGRRHAGLVVGALAGAHTVVRGTGEKAAGEGPPDARTLFQIGSVTKVFTALALADAVTRGEVSLATPLADLLPEAHGSRAADRITLGQLASHSAGLPRLPKGLRRQAMHHRLDPYRDFGAEDLLAALAVVRLRGEPGRRVRYSNFGAALLGEALSRRAGVPYAELIAERVTGPLGLTDTVVAPGPEQLRRRATGHTRPGRPVPDWDLGGMLGAGALYSTAADLLTFMRQQLTPGTTASADALRLVQEPQVRANRWVRVGLGWHLIPVKGTSSTALWHNGGTGGFASHVSLVPDADVGVVVLTSTARPVDRPGMRLLQQLVVAAPPHRGHPIAPVGPGTAGRPLT
jgi:D-alanyl-D-alanine-carboxypeptidase/D-alanyl-D-alanine-endopeptidase